MDNNEESKFLEEYWKQAPKFEAITMAGRCFVNSEVEEWISKRDLIFILDNHIHLLQDWISENDEEDEEEIKLLKYQMILVDGIKDAVEDMWHFEASYWQLKDFPNTLEED